MGGPLNSSKSELILYILFPFHSSFSFSLITAIFHWNLKSSAFHNFWSIGILIQGTDPPGTSSCIVDGVSLSYRQRKSPDCSWILNIMEEKEVLVKREERFIHNTAIILSCCCLHLLFPPVIVFRSCSIWVNYLIEEHLELSYLWMTIFIAISLLRCWLCIPFPLG